MANVLVTRERRGPETSVRYEVHQDLGHHPVEDGKRLATEEFLGLDRARLAAFGYALDGRTVTIHEVLYSGQRRMRENLIDVIDERVAFRLLNEVTLPRAENLAVHKDRLQEGVNALRP